MITLLDVTRSIPVSPVPRILLNKVSRHFGRKDRVGILAAAGSGKSTLARMLAGIEPPDHGHVVKQGRISWPIGFSGMLHPDLTGIENIHIIAGSLQRDPAAAIAFCAEFTGLGALLEQQVKRFSPVERGALAFSLSMEVPCDMYIADEVIGYGNQEVREKCDAMLNKRLERAGFIFLSKNPSQLKKKCSSFIALTNGHLIACPDVDVAAKVLELASELEN